MSIYDILETHFLDENYENFYHDGGDVPGEIVTIYDKISNFPTSIDTLDCLHKNISQIYELMDIILQTLQVSLLMSVILFGIMIMFICKLSKNKKKNVQVVQALPLTIENSEMKV